MNALRALLLKELRAEWRTKELLSALAVFGILELVVFNFAFPPGVREMNLLTPGILWSCFLFAGILGLNRSLAREKEEGCLYGLLLTPVDRGVLFLAKMLANLLFLLLTEAFLVAIFALFFSVELGPIWGRLALVSVLGSLGFCSIGTLLAAMSVQSRYQEVLLPVLLIPLASPILMSSVKALSATLGTTDASSWDFWIKFLLTFDAVFVIVSYLGFEYVVQE